MLASRQPGKLILERKTGLPYGWGLWLRRLPALAPVVAAQQMTAILAARPPPVSTGPVPLLSMWQALRQLFWQGWERAPADERGLRWFSAFISAALHVLFALFLVWVALIRTPPTPDNAGDAGRVQLQYFGTGTPQQQGGGIPVAGGDAGATGSSGAASTPRAPDLAAAAAAESEEQSTAPAPGEPGTAEPIPAPEVVPPAAQPLQVTDVAQPVSDFVLPPVNTVPAKVEAPQLRMPELQVQMRPVDIVEERPPAVQIRTPVTALQPAVSAPQVQVREREIHIAPPQTPVIRPVRASAVEVRVPTRELAVREASIPAAPEKDAAAIPGPAQMRGLAGREDVSAVSSAVPAAPGAAASPTSGTSAGAGPRSQDRVGGWEAPVKGDDWGVGKRQTAGNTGHQASAGEGLFNADGSVRIQAGADSQGGTGRGAPGGESDTWTRDRIAESGTWLKRPPYEHTPTSFDKYWVPNESLLAEWVRKGIKSIEIPIPGTNTRISCVVSLLQFGGGCGLSNPNMQEQPAEARPPPDIPFKKALQEDNGSR
ncbi:hypothetical protein [Stenotrophomonas sp. YIM B06876]|uniref:hypothetical protein n=1 Tax=Stenotrophomonas sp. YIM B06876 TaxID=3060211 RepID=UPI0027389B16|nr:hypothetical protein [Stenotrophomonas sp. YIM B06876]